MYRYLLLSVFLFAGCAAITPYERTIQQGQLIEDATLEQIQVGMSLTEVQQLLGQSTITESSSNRIDYAIDRGDRVELLSIFHDGSQVVDIQ